MPRVCEYLYHKGANTSWVYRLTIAGGGKKKRRGRKRKKQGGWGVVGGIF